jgi:hypothetical protein
MIHRLRPPNLGWNVDDKRGGEGVATISSADCSSLLDPLSPGGAGGLRVQDLYTLVYRILFAKMSSAW